MPAPLDILRQILEGADIGVWHLHVATGVVTRNNVFLRMVQATAEELRGGLSAWAQRIHPEDRDEVLEQRQRLIAGELDAYWVEYRVQRGDSSWASLRSRVAVTERDADGKPAVVCGLVMDSSRECELERRLQAVFERPFQYIGLLTPAGVLIETNRSSVGRSGHQPEEVLGKLFWEGPLFARLPAVQQQLREGIARAALGEPVRFEICAPDRDGVNHTVDFTLTPLRDDNGTVINIIPEGRDISDLARTRDALRVAEQRLNSATQAAGIGLWEWVLATDCMWFSDQWYRMLRLQPAEGVTAARIWFERVHPDDRLHVTAEVDRYLRGELPDNRLEMRIQRGDGSWGWFLSIARAVDRDPRGQASRVAGILMDISERKQAERRLAVAERLESIGQLAAGVAHEINTPVQYVNDSVYFIREAVQELLARSQTSEPDAELRELQRELPAALDRVADGLARVAEIAGSLKEFSHADHDSMVPVDLNQSIQHMLIVAGHEIKYVADVETHFGELPPVVCYGGQINQVVLNLVTNAAHAIEQAIKEGSSRGVITLKTYLDGDEAVISVSDTGPGIPELIRERIFEPFFSTKEVGRSTGQGLSVARNVVVQGHGGSLQFQTESGRGTTFFVRLPIAARSESGKVAAA
jgi:PAS domain S-box-containing protein